MRILRWCVVWAVLSASLFVVSGVSDVPSSKAEANSLADSAADLDLSDEAAAVDAAPSSDTHAVSNAKPAEPAPLKPNLVPISPAVAITPLKRSLSRAPPLPSVAADAPAKKEESKPAAAPTTVVKVSNEDISVVQTTSTGHAPRSLFEQIEAEHLSLHLATPNFAAPELTHEVIENEMEPERDEQRDVKADVSFAAKKRFRQKKESCHDDCLGEEYVVQQLKLGEPTPPCCMDLLRETTLYVHDLLDSNNIEYWAMKGTLLGVLREQGVIPHDYDIDLGTEMKNLNAIINLRPKIWSDGYMLFQAPWGKYNNMNLVIIRRTNVVTKYLKKHPPSKTELPKFTNEIRGISIAAEIMAFKPIEDTMIQVLCTATQKKNPNLYTLKTDDERLKAEYEEDHKSFKSRKSNSKDGWLTYATGQDRAWAEYQSKVNSKGVSKNCERTAPASFRYEAPVKAVLPPKKMKYFDKEINVPADADAVATIYFGKDYMTPKRRYGGK